MNEKMSDRLVGMLLVVLAIVLAFVARPAPAQEELHARASHAVTLESVSADRAMTKEGRTLYFDAGTRVLIGDREIAGDSALEALAPGMSVYVAAGRPLANGAMAVERIEILVQ